jgi:hypothetical protein
MSTNLALMALIAIVLLVILALVIYLIDKVSSLEKEALGALQKSSGDSGGLPLAAAGIFGSLSGEALWQAVIEAGTSGMDALTLARERAKYALILSRHVEALFREGERDGSRGFAGPVSNTLRITMLSGAIESWLPPSLAQNIYQCGIDFSTSESARWPAIRQELFMHCAELYQMAGLDFRSAVVDNLIPEAESYAGTSSESAGRSPSTGIDI